MRVAVLVSSSILYLNCPTDIVAAEKKQATNAIKVLEATYGANCSGVAKGNVTAFVSKACDNDALCNYRVYYKSMGGDPAPGCEKDFKVTYTCGKNSKRLICTVPPEAGGGGEQNSPNEFCLLHCPPDGSRARR